MRTIKIGIALLALTFATTACKKELEPQESSDTGVASAEQATTPVEEPTTSTETQQPATVTQPAANTPASVATTNTAQPTMAGGLNPAHGQPGHRCDIPVGSPLNAPKGGAATPAASTPQFTTADPNMKVTPAQLNSDGTLSPKTGNTPGAPALLQNPASSSTQPGMNPPHGQPGHRCDIAVGQPLPN